MSEWYELSVAPTGIDWSADGNSMVICTSDGSLLLVSVEHSRPRVLYVLHAKARILSGVKFVCGGSHAVLLSSLSRPESNDENGQMLTAAALAGGGDIRLWDVENNAFLKLFQLPEGVHVAPCTGLAVHPTSALFAAACSDAVVRCYSMHQAQPVCCVPSSSPDVRPCVAFDTQGFVFACTVQSNIFGVFDWSQSCSLSTMITDGAMCSFDVSDCGSKDSHITCLAFNPDGGRVVVATSCGDIYLIETITNQFLCTYSFARPLSSDLVEPLQPQFTPDGNFLLCVGPDEGIAVWHADGRLITTLRTQGYSPATGSDGRRALLEFNPKLALLARGSATSVSFWQPVETHGSHQSDLRIKP
eukprot:GHVS01012862.1.p1 GENE.GHVS01012862.1~~GHVS01012862.1.p1  ORF type:complete len:359 (+),score=44.17 GHVS01012862.1:179-1255(+)